jgi:hypothetical protein
MILTLLSLYQGDRRPATTLETRKPGCIQSAAARIGACPIIAGCALQCPPSTAIQEYQKIDEPEGNAKL